MKKEILILVVLLCPMLFGEKTVDYDAMQLDYNLHRLEKASESKVCVGVVGDENFKYSLYWSFPKRADRDVEQARRKDFDPKIIAIKFMKDKFPEVVHKSHKVGKVITRKVGGENFSFVKIYVESMIPLVGSQIDKTHIVIPVSETGKIHSYVLKKKRD